jgi:outer membrane protein insertion porin family
MLGDHCQRETDRKLSLRAQTSGRQYQAYSFLIYRTMVGWKKTEFVKREFISSGSIKWINRMTMNQSIKIYGTSVGLGRRLKFPDDFFTLYNEVSYQYYVLNRYFSAFAFSDGFANNLSFKRCCQETLSIVRFILEQVLKPR